MNFLSKSSLRDWFPLLSTHSASIMVLIDWFIKFVWFLELVVVWLVLVSPRLRSINFDYHSHLPNRLRCAQKQISIIINILYSGYMMFPCLLLENKLFVRHGTSAKHCSGNFLLLCTQVVKLLWKWSCCEKSLRCQLILRSKILCVQIFQIVASSAFIFKTFLFAFQLKSSTTIDALHFEFIYF